MDAFPRPRWLGVEHRHLTALATIAREGSFRSAARSLRCSQSAVSQRIGQLERMVGDRLVDRQAGGGEVAITDAGAVLLGHVDEILSVYGAARADLAAMLLGGRPQLRVGVADHVAADTLPALADRRLDFAPDVDDGSPAAQLVTALHEGRLDVIVGDPPPRSAALRIARLDPAPYALVAPATWAVVRLGAPADEDLFEQLPLLRWDDGPQVDRVDAELCARGVEPHYVADATTTTLPWLVAAGTGAAIVPAATAARWDDHVRAIPVDGLIAPREVAVSWHRDRRWSPSVEAFADALAARRAAEAAAPGPLPLRATERAA